MEETKNYNYYDIIKKIKKFFECNIHLDTKYIAFCSICKTNLCEKCLNNYLDHNGHKIYYFQKIIHNEKEIKNYCIICHLCAFYLKRIREIIIEILSEFSDIIKNEKKSKNYPLLLNIKNQLKNSYKFFHKINNYQLQYSRSYLEIYKYCQKWGYINFQIIKNIYNIKLNSVRIPDLENKDIINKIEIMINFMKDNNNYILKSSDSELPTSFYSYIERKSKNSFFSFDLSNFVFNPNKGEIFFSKGIEKSNNKSKNEVVEFENNKETHNKNIYNLEEENKDNNIINESTETSEKNNLSYNNSIQKNNEEEDLKNKNDKFNYEKENGKDENIKLYKDTKSNCDSKNKDLNINRNVINNQNEEEKEKDLKNSTIPNKKIKEFIYENLSKTCKEEVEYRDNIQYIYQDKKENRQINCLYHGEFKKGTLKRHGRGLFIWEDGEYYLGYWVDDKREGEGTNNYRNGNMYKGNFKKGKKEGDGIYQWKNGDKYIGKWKNDMKDGKGIYEYSNGDVYKGNFKMDKIDGNGSYTWANKITYKGQFKNNLIDKKGYFRYSQFFKNDIYKKESNDKNENIKNDE